MHCCTACPSVLTPFSIDSFYCTRGSSLLIRWPKLSASRAPRGHRDICTTAHKHQRVRINVFNIIRMWRWIRQQQNRLRACVFTLSTALLLTSSDRMDFCRTVSSSAVLQSHASAAFRKQRQYDESVLVPDVGLRLFMKSAASKNELILGPLGFSKFVQHQNCSRYVTPIGKLALKASAKWMTLSILISLNRCACYRFILTLRFVCQEHLSYFADLLHAYGIILPLSGKTVSNAHAVSWYLNSAINTFVSCLTHHDRTLYVPETTPGTWIIKNCRWFA